MYFSFQVDQLFTREIPPRQMIGLPAFCMFHPHAVIMIDNGANLFPKSISAVVLSSSYWLPWHWYYLSYLQGDNDKLGRLWVRVRI